MTIYLACIRPMKRHLHSACVISTALLTQCTCLSAADETAVAAVAFVTVYYWSQQIKECEFQSDGRCYIAAKLVSRCRISEHFVEDATQGLHYCQVSP
jgi:hypothetical protein